MIAPTSYEGADPARQRDLLRVIAEHYPDLTVRSVVSTSGQFNDVLFVNSDIVFRFPRTAGAAANLAVEVAVLRRLQGRLPLAIPVPAYTPLQVDSQPTLFMGYRMLPGEPLDRETLNGLWETDRRAFGRLGIQLGEFLRALHATSIDDLAGYLPSADDIADWSRLLDDIRTELFGFMRADAKASVERQFQAFLEDPRNALWNPRLRHGDCGCSNLLYDAHDRCLTGVIDFDAVAMGDPAVDLAAVDASHPKLADAMRAVYPELLATDMRLRAAFYRSTFALQQALWAVRTGDTDAFDDGIAAYV